MELARNLGARGIFLGKPDDAPEGTRLATTDWHEIARHILTGDRTATVSRHTSETSIDVTAVSYTHLDVYKRQVVAI